MTTTPGPRANPQCRACASAHRAALDAELLAGKSARAVAAWLEEQHQERIPFQALANHKARHLPVAEAVKEQLEATKPAFDAAVKKTLDVAETLDRVATVGLELAEQARDAGDEVTMPLAVAAGAGLREARAAMETKQELLQGGRNVNVTLTGAVDLPELDDDG